MNVVTGLLAFISMPTFYTHDIAFVLKIAAILLAVTAMALFYLTRAFRHCEALGAGKDAPLRAKLIAGTSLFLWFAVIALGRYIQPLQDSIARAPSYHHRQEGLGAKRHTAVGIAKRRASSSFRCGSEWETDSLNLSALVLEEKGALRSPFHYSQVTLASTPTRVHVQIYSISMAEIFECCRLSRERRC